MKYFITALLMVFSFLGSPAQNNSAKASAIRQQMASIRKSTNWSDPAAAKKANLEIQKLAKLLILTNNQTQANGGSAEEAEEDADYKMQLLRQIISSADGGEGAAILLAEPLRKEIVEEYKNDESPLIKSTEFFEESSLLVIDMSLPAIQRTIDQMEKFKSVKILIITGGKNGNPVDLSKILQKAKNYPLEQLGIINLKQFVSVIPAEIAHFKKINSLSLYNNAISKLPLFIAQLPALQTLYLDSNPITTVLPVIGSLKKLEKIGIGNTSVSKTEKENIQKILPDCQIIDK